MGFGIPNGRLALSLWLLGIAGIELCAQEIDVGPPRITEPSFTQIVNPRGVASVAVRVEGEAPFSYNWYKSKKKEGDFTTVTGEIATYKDNPDGSVNISLIIEDINEEDQGYYWVVVDNGVGQATSSAAFLGVDEPPKIIEEPKEQAVNPGESIELEVLAVGEKPFDYQWFKNGKLLQSQTQRQLSIYQADANDEGTYHVTIANTAGTATSKKAVVIINRLPVFDVQPMDLTLNPNTTAIFSAIIHGTQPLKYQWFSNGSPLEGQGIETVYNTVGGMGFQMGGGQSKVEVLLKLANVQEKNQGNYTLKVINTVGSVESRKAFLDVVDVLPLITQQPNPVKTDPGTRVRFEVKAYGTPPLTYQWYKNGKELSGQTGTSMILAVVSQDNEGQYSVEVSNTVRSVTSNKVGLWVNDPPLLLKDLADVSMPPGQTAEFEVLASGTSPLKYTWFFKGLELAGFTGNKVVIPDASLSDAGRYWVKVSNHLGEVLSKNATLKIEGVPKIIKQPADRFSLFAQNVVFSVEAIGAEPLSYQWFFDGQTIPGANKPVLQLDNVQLSDEGIYSVKVSNAVSNALSREAKLIVSGQPVILKQPKNIRTVEGTDAQFFAEAGGAEPLNYQWYFAGEKIEGSTRFFNLVEPVKGTDAGEYHVVVTNAKGRAESDKATLSLTEATSTAPLPVTAIVHPRNGATFEMGEVISLEAIAASAGSNITRLEFLAADQVIATAGKAPYEFNWEGATLGEHLLRARVVDELGQEAISGVIQISVVEPNQLPNVELTKPTDGGEFTTPADILIEASASDADGEIIQVEFLINGYLAGYSFAPPYQMRWRTGLPGEYQITARAKDNQGKSALSLPVDINVLKGYIPRKESVILWENPEDIIYGTPLGPNQLNASVTGKAGTLVYDPPDGRVLPIGHGQMLSVEFTSADGDEASRVRVSINVEPAPLRVIAENRSKLQGSPNPELTYRIEGFVNGEGESVLLSRPKIDTTAVTDSPIGVYPVTVGGAVAENYLVTHAPGQLVVVSSELILEWPTPLSIVHGTPLGPVQLNVTANEPGTFDYQPGAGRVLNAGRDQTLTAIFTPVDQIRFSAKVIQTAITVEKALPQIHWADPEAITYGAPLRAAQLNATVDVDIPGDLSYSPGPGVVMDAGANQPLTAIFAPHDKNNYTVNSITVYINVLIADSDSDGLTDGDEVNIHKTNPLIADTDSDGLTDGDEVNKYGTKPLIADTDQDGLTDGDEVNIHKTNPNLPDTDSDGLNDGDEVNKYGTDPLDADSDDDSFTDGEEVAAGTDPNDKNSNPAQDSDNDSLTDIAEVQVHKTNPTLPDTDSDGLNDGDEVNKYKTNPLVVDTDKDKFTDAEEVAAGTDPNDPDDFPINVVAPVITVPPDSVFAQSGVDVSFSVEALGEPIAYQWYKNGKPIAGADGSMLSLLNITNEAEANYRIEVSNEAGKDAREAQLTVVETAPVISDISTRFDTVYELGETARLAPKIESEGPTTYQWRKDGNDLEGETGPTLIIEDVKDADVGDYTVAATNLVGETVSETMQVSVFDEAKIGTHVENKFNLASGAIHSSPAVGQDGTIYYSTIGQSPQLYAFQPNGVNQWIEPFDSPLRGSPAIDGNGIIYVLEDAGVLHAVSPIDGKKLWQYKLTGEYADASGEPEYHRNSPAITEDNTVIFGWFDGTVYAVKDENLVWEFPTEDPFYASPSIGPDGTVYIGSSAGDLYAINSADGKPVWSKPFSTGDSIITRPAIDTDGHIYFGSNSGKFYALYPNRGEKWHFPTEQEIWSSAVIRGDGTVYFGGDDGKFYALYTETGVDPKTEKPKWVYKIDTNYQMSASAALGLDGSIYFTLFDNTFYAIKRTGEKDWSVRLKPENSDSASYSSPALLDDGKIYVGAQDGKDQGQLNVIQGGSPIDNESPWPSFGGDLQNTGRVMVKKTDADSFKAKLRVIEASGENVKIQITGDAFETYKLQHSNDLKVWKAVPNLEPIKTNFRGKADFSRTPTPDSRPVFYRLMNE